MSKRDPNFIDKHVGNRVRMRRLLIGMSQEKLGELLGITFQQVQKYEKGSNRISASRLYYLAQILGVPIQFFYDELPDTGTPQGMAEIGMTDLLVVIGSFAIGACLQRDKRSGGAARDHGNGEAICGFQAELNTSAGRRGLAPPACFCSSLGFLMSASLHEEDYP